MAAKKTIAQIGLAVVVLLGGLLIGISWWISSLASTQPGDTASAVAAFAEVRARFPAAEPPLAVEQGRIVVKEEPPSAPAPVTAAAAYIMTWQPRDQRLGRVRLPLWLARIATEPLPLDALAGLGGNEGVAGLMVAMQQGNSLGIRIADLAPYGRALLLDAVAPDGTHVIMWSE